MPPGYQSPEQVAVSHLAGSEQKRRLGVPQNRENIQRVLPVKNGVDLLSLRGLDRRLLRLHNLRRFRRGGFDALRAGIFIVPQRHEIGGGADKIRVAENNAVAFDADQRRDIRLIEAPAQPEIAAHKLQRKEHHAALFHRVALVKVVLLIISDLPRQIEAQIEVAALPVERREAKTGIPSIGESDLAALKDLAGDIEHAVGIEGHGLAVELHHLVISGCKIDIGPGRISASRQHHSQQSQNQQRRQSP